MRLAPVAAVDRVRAVVLVGDFAGVDRHEVPPLPIRMRGDALAGGFGHRRPVRVVHRRRRAGKAMRDVRERHRVDTAAHREREPRMASSAATSRASASTLTRRPRARAARRSHATPPLREAARRGDVVMRRFRRSLAAGTPRDLDRQRGVADARRDLRARDDHSSFVTDAQAERRCLGEARVRDGIDRVRPHEQAEIGDRTPLLSAARADRYVDDTGSARSRSAANAISSPVMSSTSNSSTVISSAPLVACSTIHARTMFGTPSSARVPAP